MSNSEIIKAKYADAVKGIKGEWFTLENINKWYEYVIGLPYQLQATYLIVVMNNQVFNGGFHQYFVNGYGQFAEETINALNAIGAFKKAELLKDALKIVNVDNSPGEVFRKKLLNKEIIPLFYNDDLDAPLDKLDGIYDDNSEDLEQLLGNYLQSN
jgi:hypothetical protein